VLNSAVRRIVQCRIFDLAWNQNRLWLSLLPIPKTTFINIED
jgi:hypothetical protein